jgi:ATP-binding cassette subfamily B protein
MRPILLPLQVAIVSQEPVLFAETIAANIAFGCPGGKASQEAIEAAARVANAHDFIAAFPQARCCR